MSYRIALVESINDCSGQSGSRVVGILTDPELCRYTLDRLIIRRETELHRLQNLDRKNSRGSRVGSTQERQETGSASPSTRPRLSNKRGGISGGSFTLTNL